MANYDQISQTIKSVIHKPVIVAEEPLFCTAVGVALSLVIQSPEGTTELARAIPKINPVPEPVPVPEPDPALESTSEHEQGTEEVLETKDIQETEDVQIIIPETKRMGMSYFIDVENRMPIEIIPKDETYPCFMKKSNVRLKTSSQSRMSLVLYEGHSIYDCNMRLLRKQTVEFAELTDIGTSIDISYKIDPNKIITIYASIDGEPPFEFSTGEEE